MEPVFDAADEALARWHAAMRDLLAAPKGSPEAVTLRKEVIRLRDEHQALTDEARQQRSARFNGVWER